MKIAVAGGGYVGLSLSVMLSQYHEVVLYDINKERVEMINKRMSPIMDYDIQRFLSEKELKLRATVNDSEAFSDAEYVIIATPTDYDSEKNYFDTSSIENVIQKVLSHNKTALIVIKSTIPVGYTEELRKKFGTENIIFSPEFLREGKALHDNLHPSRIIVGEKSERAVKFANLLRNASERKDVPVLLMESTEAEAVKLFANAYLAMRVAFFNELDTFAAELGLNTKDIIEGVCLDPRIGNHYNNPSFGYGGYCLPKDTKQLKAQYERFNIPNKIVQAIVESNEIRKQYIVKKILEKRPKIVGAYRLTSKANGDNFRQSAVLDILTSISKHNIVIMIYEPLLKKDLKLGIEFVLEENLDRFKANCDIIVANRLTDDLRDIQNKVITRDIYSRD